jgi:hypothetical protein
MRIYSHRINKKNALEQTSPEFGVEIDLRTYSDMLILSHDPFTSGELFQDWLSAWKGQPLILNVKEDALEEAILEILDKHGVADFFFLDQSYPSIRRLIAMGITKVATRVSDYEDLSTALKSGSDWVWLDSFSASWDYLMEATKAIAENGQKSCLVSPELQRIDPSNELSRLKILIQENNLKIDAVCTKMPESWLI